MTCPAPVRARTAPILLTRRPMTPAKDDLEHLLLAAKVGSLFGVFTDVSAGLVRYRDCLRLHRLGDRHGSIHLARACPALARGRLAAAPHHALLPVHRVGVPGAGRCLARVVS